jgi:hypothetical protein
MKHCPAPRSEAYTHRLTPVSTHLSFRWTLPLSCLGILVHIIRQKHTAIDFPLPTPKE